MVDVGFILHRLCLSVCLSEFPKPCRSSRPLSANSCCSGGNKKYYSVIDLSLNYQYLFHCLSCIAFGLAAGALHSIAFCSSGVLDVRSPEMPVGTAVWILYWKVEYIVILCSLWDHRDGYMDKLTRKNQRGTDVNLRFHFSQSPAVCMVRPLISAAYMVLVISAVYMVLVSSAVYMVLVTVVLCIWCLLVLCIWCLL